jgi:hypothetical protein
MSRKKNFKRKPEQNKQKSFFFKQKDDFLSEGERMRGKITFDTAAGCCGVNSGAKIQAKFPFRLLYLL